MLSSLFGLGLIFLINVKANFQGYLHSLVHKKEATIHYQQQYKSVVVEVVDEYHSFEDTKKCVIYLCFQHYNLS